MQRRRSWNALGTLIEVAEHAGIPVLYPTRRFTMRTVSYLCAIMLFCNYHYAWATAELATPENVVDKFFSRLNKGDADQAFTQLFEGSSIAKTDPIGVNQVSSSVSAFMKTAGPMLDFEKIDSCAIGTRTLRLTYLQNLTLRPLTWVFYYYRNSQGWTLTYLQWNGQYEGIRPCK